MRVWLCLLLLAVGAMASEKEFRLRFRYGLACGGVAGYELTFLIDRQPDRAWFETIYRSPGFLPEADSSPRYYAWERREWPIQRADEVLQGALQRGLAEVPWVFTVDGVAWSLDGSEPEYPTAERTATVTSQIQHYLRGLPDVQEMEARLLNSRDSQKTASELRQILPDWFYQRWPW